MSDYHAGSTRPYAWLRHRLTARRRPGRLGLTVASVPALMAVSLAVPFLTDGGTPGSAVSAATASSPSRILCGSWSRCNTRGYDSYRYPAAEWRAFWRMSPGDECTNYAAFVESTVYHVKAPSYLLGNGGFWADSARAHGVPVNHTPAVGAVAVWTPYTFGMGPAGHVGVVEAVGPHNSYIVISQQHMGGTDDYNWTRIKARYPADEWQEWPSYFIHFRVPLRADIGYFNPRSDTFALRDSQTAGPANRTGRLGLKGSVPLIGHWSTAGTDRPGYYNPRYGTFHLLGTTRSKNVTVTFGPAHMIPLIGDWKGTGRDGIGYYDPKTGTFALRQGLHGGPADETFKFGPAGMIPIAGDWRGKGRDGVGFYNPATGIFNLRTVLSHGPAWVSFRFGPPHMIPVVGNWSGTGHKDGVGYYNPRTGTFHLRQRLSAGPASTVVHFGPAHMIPLSGEWFGV